jgi:imidazolonepropionase-like amidohydrolase
MKIRTSILCFLLVAPLAMLHGFKPAHDPAAIAITGVSLFDADMRVMRRAMTVVVRDDRILAVGPDGETTVPTGARTIDGRGKTLLPGFVDAHASDQDLLPLADLNPAELGRFIAVQRGWQIAIAPRLVQWEQELVDEQQDTASFERLLALVRKLHHAGVPIIVKTDGSLRELELYEKAGLSPLDILYDATLGPARLAHRDDLRGSIQRGKLADMLLIDGAPDRRIGDVHNVSLVIKNGVVRHSFR